MILSHSYFVQIRKYFSYDRLTNKLCLILAGYPCPIQIQWLQPSEIQVREQQKRKCIQSVRDHNCHHHHLTKITQVVTVQQQKQDLQIKEIDWWKILNSENRVLNILREDLLSCYLFLVFCVLRTNNLNCPKMYQNKYGQH